MKLLLVLSPFLPSVTPRSGRGAYGVTSLLVLSSALLLSVFIENAETRSLPEVPETPETEAEWMIIPDMHNHLHYINLRQMVPRVAVQDDDITFYYYSRQTKSYELKLRTVEDIVKTDFNPARKTMFIIHGWTSNGQSDMNDLITSALLDVDDWNVFNIDWHKPASQNYIASKGAIPACAKIISNFIRILKDKHGLCLDHVYVAGHSLGGQMAGRVGAAFNGEIAYIIGLDPALPMFQYNNLEDRLDPSDAKHVQVIHTNGGKLGYQLPLGHADFYPNGGEVQKGCSGDIFGLCSHVRAYLYFAESIRSGNFVSHFCDDYINYIGGHCHDNHNAEMGGNQLDTSADGSYYLETNENKPYAVA